jgi:hypothetical protein
VFKFKADATTFGEEHRHLGTRTIEGNVWQAGVNSSDIILDFRLLPAIRSC